MKQMLAAAAAVYWRLCLRCRSGFCRFAALRLPQPPPLLQEETKILNKETQLVSRLREPEPELAVIRRSAAAAARVYSVAACSIPPEARTVRLW